MDCSLNGVKLKSCPSDSNTLFVDSYKEVYFDVLLLKIGKEEIIADQVSQSPAGPIVRINKLKQDDKQFNDVYFQVVLEKNAPNSIHFNVDDIANKKIPKAIPTTVLYESNEHVERAIDSVKTDNSYVDISAQQKIEEIKKQALLDIEKEKSKLSQINEAIETNKNEFQSKLDDYKAELLEQLIEVTNNHDAEFNTIVESTVEKASNEIVSTGKKLHEQQIEIANKQLTEQLDVNKKALESLIKININEAKGELNAEFDELSKRVLELFEQDKKLIERRIQELSDLKETINAFNTELADKSQKEFKVLEQALNKKTSIDIQDVAKDHEKYLHEKVNQFELDIRETLSKLSVDGLYVKLKEEFQPKFDNMLASTFGVDEDGVINEKFTFFKSKKVNEKFEQFVTDRFDKKIPGLMTQVKKLIMDFYYSYGSGGGSGNVTINQGTSGQVSNSFSSINISGLAGVSAVFDTYQLASTNTATYTIQVLSGTDIYSGTVSVIGNASVAKFNEYGMLYTTTVPFISWAVNTTGSAIQLIAVSTTTLSPLVFRAIRTNLVVS
jgi:hypothetical protein